MPWPGFDTSKTNSDTKMGTGTGTTTKLRSKWHPWNLTKDFLFRSRTFCCCFPVRMGVMVMSTVTMLISGILMIILWFEVSDNTDSLSSTERTAFIAAALLTTLLFIFSILGFSGAIVRKQSFILTYAYFLHFHLVVNVIIAAYFLWIITHVQNNAVVKACQQTVKDKDAQEQCKGIFEFAVGAYVGIVGGVLLVELYGTLIMARYVHQIKHEKRDSRIARAARASRTSTSHLLGYSSHSKHLSTSSARSLTTPLPGSGPTTPLYSHSANASANPLPYTGLPPVVVASDAPGVLHPDFNPYKDYDDGEADSPVLGRGPGQLEAGARTVPLIDTTPASAPTSHQGHSLIDEEPISPTVVQHGPGGGEGKGYAGGTLTWDQIAAEEKERMMRSGSGRSDATRT